MDTFFTSPPGGSTQPVQPAEPLVQGSIQKSPQQKVNLKKILNLGTWAILFALLPITVLIFLSQDSIPGDYFYPVKRGMENVILAAASINPAARTAFRTDLTEARFKEAQTLVISKANASGLSSFTDDVQAVQLEVTSLTNNTERAKAEDKLLAKIDQYQNSLSTLETKTERNIIAYQFQQTPTSTPPPAGGLPTSVSNQSQTPQNLLSPTPTSMPLPTLTPIPTLIPTSTPTLLSSSRTQPTPTLILTPTPIPTSTPSPTIAPTVPPQQENTQVAEQKKIAQTLKDTKEKLNKIKKDLEEKRGENRSENTQRSVGNNNEGETQSQRKNDSNKETEIPSRQK